MLDVQRVKGYFEPGFMPELWIFAVQAYADPGGNGGPMRDYNRGIGTCRPRTTRTCVHCSYADDEFHVFALFCVPLIVSLGHRSPFECAVADGVRCAGDCAGVPRAGGGAYGCAHGARLLQLAGCLHTRDVFEYITYMFV